MPVIDSHCHVSRSWYEPVELLLFQMERNGVDQALLVQMQGQYDNSYQLECIKRHPGKFASVVVIDSAVPRAADRMAELKRQGHHGIRLRPWDPPAAWQAASKLGWPISCGGSNEAFAADAFAQLVASVDVPVVIEHLGSINRPDDDKQHEVRRKVFALSRLPNAYIKLHGLGEFAPRAMPATEPSPFVQPIPPLLQDAYDAFGPARMMWGSDYPPVSGREGYANSLSMPRQALAGKAGLDDIFGNTCARVFFPAR